MFLLFYNIFLTSQTPVLYTVKLALLIDFYPFITAWSSQNCEISSWWYQKSSYSRFHLQNCATTITTTL